MNKIFNVLGGYAGELYPVKVEDKYGFIDRSGSLVIPVRYNTASPFNDGIAAVSLKEKYGYINKKGKTIIPFRYQDAGIYSEGYIAVKKGDGWGYINKKGKTVIEFLFQDAHEFSDGLASVKANGKWFYINGDGNVAHTNTYDWASSFKGGIALVENNRKFAFISTGGTVVLENLDYYLMKEYKERYPYSMTNLLEVYEGIKGRKKVQINSAVLLLIQEAKLKEGRVAKIAAILEGIIIEKNECIYHGRYEEPARLRNNEVKLIAEIKKLLNP